MRIKGLDGVRAMAAASVVVTHLWFWKTLQDEGIISPGLVASLSGGAAVQAFFVLSGLIITHLIFKEADLRGSFSWRDFMIRRALRILPLYYLIVFAVIAIDLFVPNGIRTESQPFALTMTYNFIPKMYYSSVEGHLWSIAVEEQFYLLYPLLLMWCAFSARTTVRMLLLAIAVMLPVSILVTGSEWLDTRFFPGRWTFVAGINLAFGCLAALALRALERHPAVASRVRRALPAILAGGVCLWLNEALFGLIGRAGDVLRGAGFALLYLWISQKQDSLLVRGLEWGPLRGLGTISYGIYMYQGLLLGTSPERFAEQAWPLSPELGVLLLIIIAPLSWFFFEKPILRRKTSFQRVD
jgi:peptidoglycan/LPS O-acetylase OafA/YrhL